MRNSVRSVWFLPALSIALWWAIRLGIEARVPFEIAIAIGSLVNFGLLLLISFISDFQTKPGAHFALRFKHNLRGPVVYACIAAFSVGAFHHWVAAEQTAHRKLERARFIEESLSDEASFSELQEADPRFATLDKETAKKRALDSAELPPYPIGA